MEDGVVTLLGTIAGLMVAFAIAMGLGKKYYEEDQKSKNSLSKC